MTLITLDPDLEPLIPAYIERRHEELLTLQEALNQQDFSLLQNVGHNLKGSGAGYGFSAISELGGGLEKAAMESNLTAARQEVDALQQFMATLEIRYAAA